ncbi:MAG: lytic transglycosylase domain-containing protein, partial [Micrococcales bacterium]|nr:lytic transglycosylase domain-containing protein [Micrococcales bacterium]
MTIGRDIVGNLAKQFGYSKELVRQALASNQIDPLTASLVGSRIDKMQQTKQQAASRTTVMEDVLAPKPEEVMGQGIAAVPQEAPSALAALPSNLPAEEMAGGGIVAFADGGELDLDDDEDEGREKSTLSQLMGGLSSGLASLRRAIPDTSGISIPKSYEGALAEKGQTPATVRKMMIEGPKKGDYVMPPVEASETTKRGGHKYEDAVVREAERLGVDPKLALHVLYKETGNLKNPETARSKAGAIGVMQLMPKTAKGLGVDPMNPEENIRGGITYLKQMMDQ